MSMTADRAVFDTEAMLLRYAQTRDTSIRDRIVEGNLKIAAMVARRFSGKGVDYDDLYQVASLALFKAIDRYDPEKGVKFVTFVTPTMVGEVKNYFRDRSRTIRLPRNSGEMIRAIDRATEELTHALMRQPTPFELAEHMGVEVEDVLLALEMRGASRPVSLDFAPENEDEDAPISAFFGVEEKGYSDFDNLETIRTAMDSLDARQKEVIRLRFFENLSQRDVAARLDISQMSVSRVERKALELMKTALAGTEDWKN